MSETFEDVLDSTEESIKKNYPGVSAESATRMAVVMLGMSMVYADEPPESIQARTIMHLSVEAANGRDWAVKLAGELDSSVKATIAKAEKNGADPVDVVMANHDLTRQLAYIAIARVRMAL